jgi:hypothetical protein
MRCDRRVIVLVLAGLFVGPWPAGAFERWKNPSTGAGNCSACHGDFTDDTSPAGTVFPSGDKHAMHNGSGSMDTACDLCHTSGDGRNPFLGSSTGTNDTPGLGCVGCHGRAEDAGHDGISNGLGAGLRQHHHQAGVTNCAGCHTDADPASAMLVGEQVSPAYYGSPDTLVALPCNPIAAANVNENWSIGDVIGIDNDGDGLVDSDDPDCQAGTTTTTLATTTTTSSNTTSTTAASSTTTTTPSTSTSTTSSTVSTTSTSTSTTTVVTTSTTTTTLAATIVFPTGTKLLVKQQRSGAQTLKLLAKDPTVQASPPCDAVGAFVVHAIGAGAPMARWDLAPTYWKPIKTKAPEKGCVYKKGPVVVTLLVKTGKFVKLTARGDDLGVPLATDPRPVRIELAHGGVRHCLEFGGDGEHVADEKLRAKNAAPATACP